MTAPGAQGDADGWELLEGVRAWNEVGRHPSGRWVVRQAVVDVGVMAERAAVYDAGTKRIVWHSEGANAMGWSAGGEELWVVREAGQGEYRVERRGWPGGKVIGESELMLPTGWPVWVGEPPGGEPGRGLVCVLFRDQTEAGVEVFEWDDATGRVRQLYERGYVREGTNLVEGVAFAGDGRRVAMAFGEEWWWTDEPETPSPGGRRKAGVVVVGDLLTGEYREAEVFAEVERGWDPGMDGEAEGMAVPRFEGDGRVRVRLGDGSEQVIEV